MTGPSEKAIEAAEDSRESKNGFINGQRRNGARAAYAVIRKEVIEEVAEALLQEWSPGPWIGNHRIIADAHDFVRNLE